MTLNTYSPSSATNQDFLTTVTRKGQITIPVEIRRAIGIDRGDVVSIVLVPKGRVSLAKSPGAVAKTAGMLKSTKAPATVDDLRQIAEEAVAKEVINRSSEK